MGPAPGLVDGFDAFCQVGENAGKPGPCPEGGHDQPSRPRGVTGHVTPEEGARHVAAYQAARALTQNPGESHGDFTRRRTAALRQAYQAVPSPAVKTPDVRSDLEAKHLGGDNWVLALDGTPFIAGTTTAHVRAQFPDFRIPGLNPPESPARQAKREENSRLLAEKLPTDTAGLRRLIVVSAPPEENDEGHPVSGTLSARDHADLESVADYLAPLSPGKYLFTAPAGKDVRPVAKEIRDYHTGDAKPLSADMDSLWEALADPGRRVRAKNEYGWVAVKKISDTHSLVYTPGREAPYAVAPSAKLPKAGEAETFSDCGPDCECHDCVPSPDGWDAFADKTGFSGEKKTPDGRTIRYQGGKRVGNVSAFADTNPDPADDPATLTTRRLRPDGWEEVFDPESGGWVTGDESFDPDAPPAPDDSFAEGQPCKPGERSDLTGCVPATGEARREKGQRRRESQKQDKEQALRDRLSKPAALVDVYAPKKLARDVRRLFAEGSVKPEDIPKLVGAPPGGEVIVYGNEAGDVLNFGMDHPHVKNFSRTLRKTPDGKLVMSNNLFFLKKKYRGSGMGLDVFSSEVRQLAALGVDRIDTCAGKGGIMNGYYSWARMGYDAPLDGDFQKSIYERALKMLVAQGVPEDEAGVRAATLEQGTRRDADGVVREHPPETVQDLMATEDGRALWKKHGYMVGMSFDLTPGSRSLKVLDAYLAGKGKPPASPDAAKVSALKEARVKAAAELSETEKREAALKDSADGKRHWSATCRAVGLPEADLEKRAATWEDDYARRYSERPAGQVWGLGPNRAGDPPRPEAYREAVQDMVRERHQRRMASAEPAYATTRAKMEAEAKGKGLDPLEVRRLAAKTPHPQADGVAALAASYREATDFLTRFDWLPDGSFVPKGSKPPEEKPAP